MNIKKSINIVVYGFVEDDWMLMPYRIKNLPVG